jgi:formamidopyrimidine-DNA glycosylase
LFKFNQLSKKMPELPEVETVRRGLEPVLAGAVFETVKASRADLRFPFPTDFSARLAGARAGSLDRRGKYLIAPLSTGETLIMHLGMSGRFTISGAAGVRRPGDFYHDEPPDPAHDHIAFHLNGPQGRVHVLYNDPRRFGFMDLVQTASLDRCRYFEGMGPEPLGPEFTPESLAAALEGRRSPLKAALLDQGLVAGLGNIYVCEALFRAGLSPRRLAANLPRSKIEPLVRAIRAVLEEAIAAGGSTLRDFAASDGAPGRFQQRFRVYGREGEPCLACGSPVRRFVQSGRSTFACGRCQR